MGKETMRDKLEEVILASYESMYRMAFVYMKNESDALDVVQESVVKAIKSSGQLKEESYMKTWLFLQKLKCQISYYLVWRMIYIQLLY